MPATLSAALKRAFTSATCSPVYLIRLDLDGGVTYKFTDARTALFSYPMSLERVTKVSREFDPFTRKARVGQFSVRLTMDKIVEGLIVNNRLRGKAFTLELGDASVQEADFLTQFSGMIEDATPVDSGTRLLIKVVDAVGMALDQKIVGMWSNKHPRGIIRDIFQNRLFVPPGLLNAANFYWNTDLRDSHYVMSKEREGGGGLDIALRVPTSAYSVIWDRLLPLLNGAVIVGEDGLIDYVKFDETASVVDTWTEDDLASPYIEQVDMVGQIVNRVTVKSHPQATYNGVYDGTTYAPGEPSVIFTLNDTSSQADHVYPGVAATGIFEQIVDASWVIGLGRLAAGISVVHPDTLTVEKYNVHAMAGTHNSVPGPQDADSKVSGADGRYAYLKINDEIIKASGSGGIGSSLFGLEDTDPQTGAYDNNLYPNSVDYTGIEAGRGQFGTTPVSHDTWSTVYDITIPVQRAQELLKRWSRGAPVIRVTTRGLHKISVRVGELVSVVTGRYRNFGRNGVGTETKWEVAGKEYDREKHVIRWTLVWATQTGVAAPTQGMTTRQSKVEIGSDVVTRNIRNAMLNQDVGNRHVLSGFEVNSSGLGITVAPGASSAMLLRGTHTQQITFTLSTFTDAYVVFDLEFERIEVKQLTAGSVEPSFGQSELLLAKVSTGASGVIATDDRRVFKAVDGIKLVNQSVASDQLASGAAIGRVIAGDAVTSDKVAQGQLGPFHFAAQDAKTNLVFNAHFAIATRG